MLPHWALDLHSLHERVLDLVEVGGAVLDRMLLLVVLAHHLHGLELVRCRVVDELLLEGAFLDKETGKMLTVLTFVSIMFIREIGVFNNDRNNLIFSVQSGATVKLFSSNYRLPLILIDFAKETGN